MFPSKNKRISNNKFKYFTSKSSSFFYRYYLQIRKSTNVVTVHRIEENSIVLTSNAANDYMIPSFLT